jgi:hypothetical protein
MGLVGGVDLSKYLIMHQYFRNKTLLWMRASHPLIHFGNKGSVLLSLCLIVTTMVIREVTLTLPRVVTSVQNNTVPPDRQSATQLP